MNNFVMYDIMPKIIIDVVLLDHLLIKFPGKFNAAADMSLQ